MNRVIEQWPPDVPSDYSKCLTMGALRSATEKFIQLHKLDSTDTIGNTSNGVFIFNILRTVEPPHDVVFCHGVGTYATPEPTFLTHLGSVEVLRSLHPAHRVCGLQKLAWDFARDIFEQRYEESILECDDPRVLRIFKEFREELLPIVHTLESDITDDAMSEFLETTYTYIHD